MECSHCKKGKLGIIKGDGIYNIDYLECNYCNRILVLESKIGKVFIKEKKKKDIMKKVVISLFFLISVIILLPTMYSLVVKSHIDNKYISQLKKNTLLTFIINFLL